MHHQEQVAQARKLFAYLETRTTAMADGVYRNPVDGYIAPLQAARERDVFFRRGPIVVGLSCLLPKPGDYMTHDHAGVPLLLVRRGDGSLGAYLNVCRHRGARLAEGCGSGARTFSCPYHGWTYGAEGGLLTRPEEGAFTPADKAMHGLRPVPVVETHGIIWLAPSPATRFDGTTLLDGLESEFESYGFAAYHHYETRLLRRPINWKLAVDTFLEGYHIGVLHTKTIAQILHSNRVTFDRFGRNLRLIIPRRSIALLRRLPEADWDLVSHSAIVYLLFPNTVVIMAGDHLETWHVFPAGNGIDECAMRVTLYTPEPAVTASAKGHWDRNFDLLMATVEQEDFPLSEGIQRGFHSGAQDHVLFGRNEPALQHFHRAVDAALASDIPPARDTEAMVAD